MSSDRIYLSKDEQNFLMDMLEVSTPMEAAEKFAVMMSREGADPTEMQAYTKKIMKAFEEKVKKGK